MRQLLILTGPLLNLQMLRHTAEQHFDRVEVLKVSEIFLGRIQSFFSDKEKSGVMVIVDAGNFVGGYQTLLRLVQAVEAEKHYLTHVPSDCPVDDRGELQPHVLEAWNILDRSLDIIRGLYKS